MESECQEHDCDNEAKVRVHYDLDDGGFENIWVCGECSPLPSDDARRVPPESKVDVDSIPGNPNQQEG
jgi:hypothetical protein